MLWREGSGLPKGIAAGLRAESSTRFALRRLARSTPAKAGELNLDADVFSAEKAGAMTIAQPRVVLNMPYIDWDGGKR